jgi:hypothetical protein
MPITTSRRNTSCDAYFDNSAGNLMNPDPSKSVHWGDQSWDEMMIGTMVVTKVDDVKEAQVSSLE